MRQLRSLGYQTAALIALGACSADESPQPNCPGALAQPIVFGQPEDAYLGATPAQLNAVVSVQFDDSSEQPGVPCSGVLVAADWVLGARHCLPRGEVHHATVRFGQDRDASEATLGSHAWELPPVAEVDAVLLRLDSPVETSLAEPLRLSSLAASDLVGARVLLGGYGYDENAKEGQRRFVTERVASSNANLLTVDGEGRSGACVADSGGPALWREGAPVVVGILRDGDSNCRGRDDYSSAESLRDWVSTFIGDGPEASSACGKLGMSGACFDSMALSQAAWCDGQMLRTAQCGPGTACGWDSAESGYRCVAPERDGCQGVSQLGACSEGALTRCEEGELRALHCQSCERCTVAPGTGRASCEPIVP